MKNNDYASRVFKYDNSWVCEYPDLPGCTGIGNTAQEAVADGEVAKELWLEVYFEDHGEYPVATDVYSKDYSGYLDVYKRQDQSRMVIRDYKIHRLNASCP